MGIDKALLPSINDQLQQILQALQSRRARAVVGALIKDFTQSQTCPSNRFDSCNYLLNKGWKKNLFTLPAGSPPHEARLVTAAFVDDENSREMFHLYAAVKAVLVYQERPNLPGQEERTVGALKAYFDCIGSPKIPRHIEIAYRAYEYATSCLDGEPTDDHVYDWLRDSGSAEYDPPSRETWKRYVREYRRLTGQNKRHRRTGRSGRSVVRQEDL